MVVLCMFLKICPFPCNYIFPALAIANVKLYKVKAGVRSYSIVTCISGVEPF